MPIDDLHLPDLAVDTLVALHLIYFASFVVRGAIGLGSLSPTVLFGTLVVGPHNAVLLALLTNLASQVQFLPQALSDGDWTIARRILIPNFAGAAVGVWMFNWIDPASLTIVLGLALGLVVVADITRVLDRLAQDLPMSGHVTMLTLSAVAGLISGIAGAGGLLLIAVYLRLICPEPRTLRGTILLMSLLIVAWRFFLLLLTGQITIQLLVGAATLLPVVILGGWVGHRIFSGLSRRRFYQVFQVVILLAASILLVRGLMSLGSGDPV